MTGPKDFRILVGAALFAMGLAGPLSSSASAALVACTGSEAVTIEGAGYTSCMVDTAYNSGNEVASVNLVFGAGWTLVAKSDDAGSGLTADTASTTGTFAMLLSLFDPTDDIALVFKTGLGKNDPTDAVFGLWTVGSLNAALTGAATDLDGTYDLSSWGPNALSHMSVFSREGQRKVPEPGPLGLLGLGMIALYVGRRRRFLR